MRRPEKSEQAGKGELEVGFVSKIVTLFFFSAISAGAAFAQQKITIGGTPNSGPATAMVADTEGIFQKHGLEATYTLITINPSIPPALLAGSLQIGIPTPTTFLQAVDGGLDLVVIAGVADNSKDTPLQIVVRMRSPGLRPQHWRAQSWFRRRGSRPGLGRHRSTGSPWPR